MEPSLRAMKNLFNGRLGELLATKGHNTQIFTETAYSAMMQKVKESKVKVTSKTPEDYHRLKKYDVVTLEGAEKLIVPLKAGDVMKFYVHTEEVFQILHDAHLALNHGGRTRMEREINFKYKNITREMIVLFLNLCEICRKKQSFPQKSLAVGKPVLSNETTSKCQVDFIDMQLRPDGKYKFVLVYQDNRTKFVQLRPLQSCRADEVAYALVDIFTIFNAPGGLECSKGAKFAYNVIRELCAIWSELKIVPLQMVEPENKRAKQDVDNRLTTWLKDNNTKRWSEGLRFVQLMKNRTRHSVMNCSPFEAMFGAMKKFDVPAIPAEVKTQFKNEDDEEIRGNVTLLTHLKYFKRSTLKIIEGVYMQLQPLKSTSIPLKVVNGHLKID